MSPRKPVTVTDVFVFEAGAADERARLAGTIDRLSLYAARYALGRRTYAVADVVELLIGHRDMLSVGTRDVLIGDIETAIERNDAGMDMDRREWERLLAALAPTAPEAGGGQ